MSGRGARRGRRDSRFWPGAPPVPVLQGLPPGLSRGIGRLVVPGRPLRRLFETLTRPLVATGLDLAAIGIRHLPARYDAAQGRTAIHDLEHLVLLRTALLYRWPVLHPVQARRLSCGPAILSFVPSMVEGNLIGALLAFAGSPLYETCRLAPRLFGLSALEEQHLGGLITGIGGAFFWFAALTVVVFVWAGEAAAAAPGGPLEPGLAPSEREF